MLAYTRDQTGNIQRKKLNLQVFRKQDQHIEQRTKRFKMPTNNETAEKPAKIDELMSDIDLTKPFINLNNGDHYEIGSLYVQLKIKRNQ